MIKLMRFWHFGALLFFVCTSAFPQDFSEYISDSNKFLELVNSADPATSMPRTSKKETAALIASLSNSDKYLSSSDLKGKYLTSILNVCDIANKIVMSYVLYNAKNAINPKDTQDKIRDQLNKLTQSNIKEYQAELELLQPFLIRCLAKQTAPMTDFMMGLKKEDLTEVRISGLKMASTGVTNAYLGSMILAVDLNFSINYRVALLDALTESAEEYQKILTPASRKAILNFISENMNSINFAFHGYFDSISKSMSNTSCEKLCALQQK